MPFVLEQKNDGKKVITGTFSYNNNNANSSNCVPVPPDSASSTASSGANSVVPPAAVPETNPTHEDEGLPLKLKPQQQYNDGFLVISEVCIPPRKPPRSPQPPSHSNGGTSPLGVKGYNSAQRQQLIPPALRSSSSSSAVSQRQGRPSSASPSPQHQQRSPSSSASATQAKSGVNINSFVAESVSVATPPRLAIVMQQHLQQQLQQLASSPSSLPRRVAPIQTAATATSTATASNKTPLLMSPPLLREPKMPSEHRSSNSNINVATAAASQSSSPPANRAPSASSSVPRLRLAPLERNGTAATPQRRQPSARDTGDSNNNASSSSRSPSSSSSPQQNHHSPSARPRTSSVMSTTTSAAANATANTTTTSRSASSRRSMSMTRRAVAHFPLGTASSGSSCATNIFGAPLAKPTSSALTLSKLLQQHSFQALAQQQEQQQQSNHDEQENAAAQQEQREFIAAALGSNGSSSSLATAAAGSNNDGEFSGLKIYFEDKRPRDSIVVTTALFELGFTRVTSPDTANILYTSNEMNKMTRSDLHTLDPTKQRVTGICGMRNLCRKAYFCAALNIFESLMSSNSTNAHTRNSSNNPVTAISPRTFIVPQERAQLKQYDSEFTRTKQKRTYIVKPDGGSCGENIFLADSAEQVLSWTTRHHGSGPEGERWVVQEYVSRPLLFEKRFKFDLRVYVLVLSVLPLRFHIYKEGYARMAVIPYEEPSKKNMNSNSMFLTNYSLAKKTDKFVENTGGEMDDAEGTKRSISTAFAQLKQQYPESFDGDAVWRKIYGVTELCLKCMQPFLAVSLDDVETSSVPSQREQQQQRQQQQSSSSMSSSLAAQPPQQHVVGFDYILDENLNLFVLEGNTRPNYLGGDNVGRRIGGALASHAFRIASLPWVLRRTAKKAIAAAAAASGTPDEVRLLRAAQQAQQRAEAGPTRQMWIEWEREQLRRSNAKNNGALGFVAYDEDMSSTLIPQLQQSRELQLRFQQSRNLVFQMRDIFVRNIGGAQCAGRDDFMSLSQFSAFLKKLGLVKQTAPLAQVQVLFSQARGVTEDKLMLCDLIKFLMAELGPKLVVVSSPATKPAASESSAAAAVAAEDDVAPPPAFEVLQAIVQHLQKL